MTTADLFELPTAYVVLAEDAELSCITYTPGSWSDLLGVSHYAKERGWVVPNDPKRGVFPETDTLPDGTVRVWLAPVGELQAA